MFDVAPGRWGPELRTTFNLLCEQVLEAAEYWANYRALVPSREAADLLRSIANDFFALVQGALANSVILSLGRLSDPPGTPGRYNLSFPRLLMLIDGALDPALVAEAKGKWQALVAARGTLSIRALRNKRLAHTDLAVVSGTTTVAGVSVGEIEALLGGMRDILETLAARGGVEISLDTGCQGDAARGLLRKLQCLGRAEVAARQNTAGEQKTMAPGP
ncbi:MAG: hypothetical protein ABSG86_09570 [Thermoguttaceae bacterium]|jgi:hypothetical protein